MVGIMRFTHCRFSCLGESPAFPYVGIPWLLEVGRSQLHVAEGEQDAKATGVQVGADHQVAALDIEPAGVVAAGVKPGSMKNVASSIKCFE